MNEKEMILKDSDNNEIKQLKRQIINLQAQLEIQRARSERNKGGKLLKTEAIDFYPGEQLDFVLF